MGFALETRDGVAHARAKLRQRSVDLIVLNTPADGLGGETNQVTLVEARGRDGAAETMPKREVAEAILDRVLELRGATRRARAPGAGSAPGTARKTAAARARAKGSAAMSHDDPRREAAISPRSLRRSSSANARPGAAS